MTGTRANVGYALGHGWGTAGTALATMSVLLATTSFGYGVGTAASQPFVLAHLVVTAVVAGRALAAPLSDMAPWIWMTVAASGGLATAVGTWIFATIAITQKGALVPLYAAYFLSATGWAAVGGDSTRVAATASAVFSAVLIVLVIAF